MDSTRHFAYDPSKALTIYQSGCADQLTASVNRTAIRYLDYILPALFLLTARRHPFIFVAVSLFFTIDVKTFSTF